MPYNVSDFKFGKVSRTFISLGSAREAVMDTFVMVSDPANSERPSTALLPPSEMFLIVNEVRFFRFLILLMSVIGSESLVKSISIFSESMGNSFPL